MIRLPPDAPGKPHASNITHDSLQLNWNKPSHGSESVQSYTIFYRVSDSDDWNSYKLANQHVHVRLFGLVPKTAYVFKVRAESAAGPSPDSELSDCIETHLPISEPGKPTATRVTHNSITMKWDKPERGADIVEHYTIFYRRSIDVADVWNALKAPNRKVMSTVFNLNPKMFYIFKVRAESATATSPESESSDPIETLSPIGQPGKPHATKVTHNSITLQWSKPDHSASIVQYYTIFYRRYADHTCRSKWTAFQTSNAQQETTLINFDPKTSYVFKLRAESATGPSPDSEVSDPIETLRLTW